MKERGTGVKIDGTIKISNAKHIDDLEGFSKGVKVEVAAGPGGGASVEAGVDAEGNYTYVKEVGLSANAGTEISIAVALSKTVLDNDETLGKYADSINEFFNLGNKKEPEDD